MAVKRLDQDTFGKWVDSLVKNRLVQAVQAKGDRFAFGPLEDPSLLRLDYDVALLPPKKYFLPQVEDLVKFKRPAEFQAVTDVEPFVLLGVHPYDLVAIRQMDKIFLEEGELDKHYKARREAATIVACDVENASENVFASSMGTATVDDGFDVLLTKTDGGYLADIRTDKGQALFDGVDAPDASEDDLKKREAVQEEIRKSLNKHALKMTPEKIGDYLEKGYENPVWEEKAKLCYSCGSCNLVCPTCYCFDVRDDVDWNMQDGVRSRVWDACLLEGFALVAGDHNFRPERAERFRHRYYRKGKYVPEKIGEISCVGCGRCITACTANIANPVEIYNRLMEGK